MRPPFVASALEACIEKQALHHCSGLAMRDLKLPDSLEELGTHDFAGCRRFGLTGKLFFHITGEYLFFEGCIGRAKSNCWIWTIKKR
jgi:hypothetical protein